MLFFYILKVAIIFVTHNFVSWLAINVDLTNSLPVGVEIEA